LEVDVTTKSELHILSEHVNHSKKQATTRPEQALPLLKAKSAMLY